MKIDEFAGAHPPHQPRIPPSNEDELRQLTAADGVWKLSDAPAKNTTGDVPSRKGDTGCILWVITGSELPYVPERARVSPPLASGMAKHTNLTGGGSACCGGEMWFETPNATRVYLNGCSGRYGPTSAQQLVDAVEVFEQMGYDVVSFGWDRETNRPRMVLRENDG